MNTVTQILPLEATTMNNPGHISGVTAGVTSGVIAGATEGIASGVLID